MVFTKYSYYVKLLLCFVPSEFLEKANIWTEVHGSIKLILTPYSMVGHIWPNLIFFFIFEVLLMLVTLPYTLVKWCVF